MTQRTTMRVIFAVPIIVGLILLFAALAVAQTGPVTATLCGLTHLGTPSSSILQSGSAAAYASQSVANTTASAAPTRPTVTVGLIVAALVDVEQAGIRFRVDGTTPSGTFDGVPVATAGVVQVCGADLGTWRAIASSTGANAILRWRFYMQGGG